MLEQVDSEVDLVELELVVMEVVLDHSDQLEEMVDKLMEELMEVDTQAITKEEEEVVVVPIMLHQEDLLVDMEDNNCMPVSTHQTK